MPVRSIVAGAIAAIALGAAPAAFGHAVVVKRTPAPGDTVANAKRVTVRFSQSLTTGLITVSRGGREVAAAATGLDARRRSVLRAAFSRPLPRGTYVVTWRALAPDGHRQSGTWSFRVR